MTTENTIHIAGEEINGRLWLGTSMYPSPEIMRDSLVAGKPGFVTLSLRRQTAQQVADNGHWQYVQEFVEQSGCKILPNTAGCHTAEEAVLLSNMARELFKTDWIKLEVIGDDYTLQPHTTQLVKAAETLVQQGFKVLPYCTDDLVLCKELLAVGCPAVMPWGAPIGTGKGLLNRHQLTTLRERLADEVLIIDAGLGKPSQAMDAMELGFDAVLLNTAVAKAHDPVLMANAFYDAVNAGRMAYKAGMMQERQAASASTPTLGMPFWHQG